MIEFNLSVEDFAEKYLKPAMVITAKKINKCRFTESGNRRNKRQEKKELKKAKLSWVIGK